MVCSHIVDLCKKKKKNVNEGTESQWDRKCGGKVFKCVDKLVLHWSLPHDMQQANN